MQSNPSSSSSVSSVKSSGVPIDVRSLNWTQQLASDYIYNFNRLEPFFAGNPTKCSDWEKSITRRHETHYPNNKVVDMLIAQQRQRQAPPNAITATTKLRDPRTIAIVTGQQAGLFGGPLFTLLKALTTIKLANQVSQDYTVPTVAVFWIDADDHDWEEVRSCSVLDSKFQRQKISLPLRTSASEQPMGSILLDDSIAAAIDELATTLNPSEFSQKLLTDIRATYRPGVRFVEAFGRWLETLLGNYGLIVFDGSDPVGKDLTKEVFVRELKFPGQTSKLAAETGAALVDNGYHAQVTQKQDTISLFNFETTRRPIKLGPRGFMIGDTSVTTSTLVDEASLRPERFSPNVLLRPIVQDTIFPTVCYVAGPNELAYLAQLKKIYSHFSVPMPLIYPRTTATIVDSATAKFLARYEFPFQTLQAQDEAALNRLLESQLPSPVEESLNDVAKAIHDRMIVVARKVSIVDDTLVGATQSTQKRIERELQNLHNKVIQAAKRKDQTLRRQYIRACSQAFPDGRPQERELGILHFLNRYGPTLVDRVAEVLSLDLGYHWVITI